MNESQERAAAVLDKAIAEVFRNEIARLSAGLNFLEKSTKVRYALDELSKLRIGKMPKYDEWVSPFYLNWYQGSQINLAYSTITGILGKESICKEILTDTGRLYVFDFGCGALAMQFGVVLAIADALQKNQKIHSAYIACEDESEAMTNIGKRVWEQFKSEIHKDAGIPYLEQACELIDTQTDKHFRMPHNDESSWISAIHAAYAVNKGEVKKVLARRTDEIRPNAGLVTSHKTRTRIADFISPFHRNDEYIKHKQNIHVIFTGELPETTKARRALRTSLWHPQNKFVVPPIELGYSVTWEWRDATIHIYTRQ